jgi:hypothetical protein
MSAARQRLAILWISFLFADLTIGTYLHLIDWMEADNYKKLLSELNASYAPYLGIMLVFFWTKRKSSGSKVDAKERDLKIAFRLAFVSSLAWNLLIFVLLIRHLFGYSAVEQSLEWISDFRAAFSWLVAGSTAFFFGCGQ